MRQWTGFMEPDRLLEELIPFVDHGVNDPEAAKLAAGAKRKGIGRGGGGGGVGRVVMNEEEELQTALAASLEAASGEQHLDKKVASSPLEDAEISMEEEEEEEKEEEEEEEEEQGLSVEEVMMEAAARLPSEEDSANNDDDNNTSVRVAIRFPDGSRQQRRFPSTAALQALVDFCLSKNEEAARGRAFGLAEAFPGAPELCECSSRSANSNNGSSDGKGLKRTLKEAGACDTMLVMKWKE
jgi:hypothetical protein